MADLVRQNILSLMMALVAETGQVMKETFRSLTEWFQSARNRNFVVVQARSGAYIAWRDIEATVEAKPDFRAKKGEYDIKRDHGWLI